MKFINFIDDDDKPEQWIIGIIILISNNRIEGRIILCGKVPLKGLMFLCMEL